MRATADLFTPARVPTADEHDMIDRVYSLCRDWQAGMPVTEVQRHSSGYERWIAYRFTPVGHSMRRPLEALLDDLIEKTPTGAGGYMHWTPQGWFTDAQLRAVEARTSYRPDGSLRVVFPIRHPWRVKPSEGFEGERGDPIYAETYEERTRWANAQTER